MRFAYQSVVGALAVLGAQASHAQQPATPPAPPIRTVTAPTAVTTEPLKSASDIREIGGGRLLVNASGDRKLLVFDASLAHATVVADTMGGAAAPYPRFAKLIPYAGDSTFLLEADSRSMVVVDPQGTLGRVVAPPRLQDFNLLTSGGPAGTDSRGNLVYQGQRPFAFPPGCRPAGAEPLKPPPATTLADSVAIIRANFDTRGVDTIGRSKVNVAGFSFPNTVRDANCKALSASVKINPSVQSSDAWTVTSRGSVAIVRGHDYHVDFVDADGTTRSGPRLPYDWRRLTDADKQARIDSARKVVDSLTALGGYRLEVCGNSSSFNTSPPQNQNAPGRSVGGSSGSASGAGSGGGRGGFEVAVSGDGARQNPACQTLTVAAEFAPLGEMADYIAPFRENAARADLDGNVWILPSTSFGAKGGLLYDVIGPKGDMIERVQLPADRDIIGFGRNGVLYLSHQLGVGSVAIERVKIVGGALINS